VKEAAAIYASEKPIQTESTHKKIPSHTISSRSSFLTKRLKPTMARLTLARKIAAITLIVWKKGVNFDAKRLKQQAA
jgi:hypothetical protein